MSDARNISNAGKSAGRKAFLSSPSASLRPASRSRVKPEHVVQRLWRAADRQIAESERRMEADADEAIEREARTLSVLGKLVRELAEIDIAGSGSRPSPKRSPTRSGQDVVEMDGEAIHGDTVDIERFRAALAQDVDRLRQERGVDAASGAADGGRA